MMRRKPDIKPPLTEEEIEKRKQAFIKGAKADSQKPVKPENQKKEDFIEGDEAEWQKPVKTESQKDSDTETQSIDGRVQELEGRVQELEEIVRELLTNQI